MIRRLIGAASKLRGRTSHELFTRASQEAYAWSERALLRFGTKSLGVWPNADRSFARPFFEGVNIAPQTVAALRTIAPHDQGAVLERARRIESGDIPVLGYGYIQIGPSPNWQRDPVSGLTAPLRHWKTIPYLDPTIVGDHKVVWEISRHQYFVTLGQAWQYSRDERWPRAFVRYLDSWLYNNAPSVGMNWASSLEVSYRAISWIWAMQLMRDAETVDAGLKSRMLQSLHEHGRHLERYLSTYFSPNTHLTGEALGLFYIGTQCPELPRAARWTAMGAKILESALALQVLPDGVYFEQASQYHRYTIDIYLHYLLLARQSGREPAPIVHSSLQKLFDVLLHLTRADGTIALVGDDDGGRLVQLDERRPDEVRGLLATGAAVLQRSDLAWAGRGDDVSVCWMLGESALIERDALVSHPPSENGRGFTFGGIYTMRDGWAPADGHATIDAGVHGALSFGHSHADALSVELALTGRPLFVDAGTYTYVGAERDAFRTTAAHNTVEIDGTSTSRPLTAFRWSTTADARATAWVNDSEFCYFAGTHNGYDDLPSPAQHERSVLLAAPGLWIVLDKILATGPHNVVLRWHCASGLSAVPVEGTLGYSALRVHESECDRAVVAIFGGGGAMHVEHGWVSPQFACKTAAAVLTWNEQIAGNALLGSVVIDSTRWELRSDASSLSNLAGPFGTLLVREKSQSEIQDRLILLGNKMPMRYQGFSITADVACFQLKSGTELPIAMMAVGATQVNLDGRTLLPPGTQNRWIHVSAIDAGSADRWQVRTGETLIPDVAAMNTKSRISLLLTQT